MVKRTVSKPLVGALLIILICGAGFLLFYSPPNYVEASDGDSYIKTNFNTRLDRYSGEFKVYSSDIDPPPVGSIFASIFEKLAVVFNSVPDYSKSFTSETWYTFPVLSENKHYVDINIKTSAPVARVVVKASMYSGMYMVCTIIVEGSSYTHTFPGDGDFVREVAVSGGELNIRIIAPVSRFVVSGEYVYRPFSTISLKVYGGVESSETVSKVYPVFLTPDGYYTDKWVFENQINVFARYIDGNKGVTITLELHGKLSDGKWMKVGEVEYVIVDEALIGDMTYSPKGCSLDRSFSFTLFVNEGEFKTFIDSWSQYYSNKPAFTGYRC